jgi:hypothetical protein
MINLLTETLNDLRENEKETSDVLWVGNDYFKTTWENFAKIAENFNYNWGLDDFVYLKIVGKDWWLERNLNEESEWWEFKTLPEEPRTTDEIVICKKWRHKTLAWKSETTTSQL